ncbi:hypothetical protein ACIBQ1_58335 [Nonomuraea sp. NPDC050153]|uniref:hypothetical protein n=1 Tax=Nonomuraea sp. NPDC050153 TaxID=3364359 RepID=UPI0037AEF04D
MLSTIRKPLAVLTATGLLSLAACSGAQEDKQQQASNAITIFAPQGPEYDLANSTFTRHLQQKFGIKLQFETTTYDAAAAKEKRQISLASGDFPDVYMLIAWVDVFSQSELLRLAKQGVPVPLNDLIDKYAPNIKKAFEQSPEYKKMATAPDGKIYGLPQWNDCFHCSYSAKLWMNSAWLKKLNLKQPTTTEEMREVLKAFKTKDPNGNGKADEIPLSGSTSDTLLSYFMNAFLYDPQAGGTYPSTLALGNGKVQYQPAQPGWREGLRYVASLYKDGLIDKGAFTQNRDALKATGSKADAAIVGAATVQHPGILVSDGLKDDRRKHYDAVPPLAGPTGVRYTAYNLPSVPGAAFVITSKASEQTRISAIKMLDYVFTTEGHLLGEFGDEGVWWTKPGPGDVALDEKLTPLFKTIPAKPDVQADKAARPWGAMAQYYAPKEFRNAQVQATDVYSPDGYERRLFDATKLYEGKEPKDQIYPYWNVWISPDVANEVATLQTNIENFATQSSLQFVTGQKNIDDDVAWNAYLKGLNDLGLPRYLELQQQAYQGR